MAPAGTALEERFRKTSFREPKIPVLFNCLGREKGPEDSIPALLVRQVQSSVYMEDTIRRMEELGAEALVEIGPRQCPHRVCKQDAASNAGVSGGDGGGCDGPSSMAGPDRKGETSVKLENQVAIVTGGSRGIGRAVCLELARRGAHVVLCYAGNTEAAQSTVAACEALGVRALAIQASVADEAAIQTLVAQTLRPLAAWTSW